MLKATFSKHWLIEISITYVIIKSEVTKVWYNSSNYSYKWSLYWMITWKLLFDGEENDTFDKWGCKFCEEDFSLGKWVNFWMLGGIVSHLQFLLSAWVSILLANFKPVIFSVPLGMEKLIKSPQGECNTYAIPEHPTSIS